MYGVKCVVYTDNIALKSLLSAPHPSGKLAHWELALQELDLDIRQCSGKEKRHADALSREPLQSINKLCITIIVLVTMFCLIL